ncbi:unnamed protein product, partial [Arabidopsis halleri]
CASGSALIFRRFVSSSLWFLADLVVGGSASSPERGRDLLVFFFVLDLLTFLFFSVVGLYGSLSGSILRCAFLSMVSSGFEVGFAPCFYIQDLIEVWSVQRLLLRRSNIVVFDIAAFRRSLEELEYFVLVLSCRNRSLGSLRVRGSFDSL